jgi:hypothetical protein
MAKRPRPAQTTVPKARPPRRPPTPHPPKLRRPSPPPAARHVAHIIDDSERSLVDVLDSLLNQGVVLNAELVLALANVDLVYLRLSALLCAADRVLPRRT